MGWIKKENKFNGFGGPGWSRSIEPAYEEEGEHVLDVAPLAVGAGAVYLDGGKSKRQGFIVEVFSYRQRFSEVVSE